MQFETMDGGAVNQGFVDVEKSNNTYTVDVPVPIERLEPLDTQQTKSSVSKNTKQKYKDCRNVYLRNRTFYKYFKLFVLNAIVITYFIFATLHWKQKNENTCNYEWCDGYGLLIILATLCYGYLFYFYVLKRFLEKPVSFCFSKTFSFVDNLQLETRVCCSMKTIVFVSLIIALLLFIILDSLNSTRRLISLIGVVVITAVTWGFSKYPKRVDWRPVISGFLLQLTFGLIVVRWSVGRLILKCISAKIESFLNLSLIGSKFVYSNYLVEKHVFAFTALPVIFFMSFMVQILYYLGIMQCVISKLGSFLQKFMGTTVCESMNASANIFLGMTESPLLIKPYISRLTASEIHAVMCCGFATVSGTVMAAYISFGADPSHLITASIMSAPAALSFSKLSYPETEKTLTSYKNIKLEKSNDTSLLDAATKGAVAAIPLILNIIANIIAFLSFVAFCDGILEWSAQLIGFHEVTFKTIMAKICMPLSWLIGIPWDECEKVGYLIGLKTIVNEFIAFQQLGEYKKLNLLSPRSQAIATYAICGFSNPASVGILIASLISLAPDKSKEITSVAIRAFIIGSFVCFVTACIAGVLITDEFYDSDMMNATAKVH